MNNNSETPYYFFCPCGGGQSCIVNRRHVGDYVDEDNIFKKVGLDIRKNCHTPFTIEQQEAMNNYMKGFNSVIIKNK